jgi:putative colanic acid biosynthesis acetyltransferase WcaF
MMDEALDIAGNRSAKKYSAKVQLMRVMWSMGRWLFRLVPRPLFAPRRLLLRLFGARIGRNVHVSNTAVIYFPWNLEIGDWSAIGDHAFIYNLGRVTIGQKTTISQRAHLCAGTHDYKDPSLPLLTPPIAIGNQAWVCADAFVGSGVSVGEGAVVGARAVVTRNVEAWAVVVGNPARKVKERELMETT